MGETVPTTPTPFTVFPSMKTKGEGSFMILVVKSYPIFCLILAGRASDRFLSFPPPRHEIYNVDLSHQLGKLALKLLD